MPYSYSHSIFGATFMTYCACHQEFKNILFFGVVGGGEKYVL